MSRSGPIRSYFQWQSKNWVFIALLLLLANTTSAKEKDATSPILENLWTAPGLLFEVSGISWRKDPQTSELQLMAISDRKFDISVQPWLETTKMLGPGRLVSLTSPFPDWASHKKPFKRSQTEAVQSDQTGRAFLLREDPACIFVTNPELTRVEKRINLQIPANHPIAKYWNLDPGSRAEGFILLKSGHILVAKEKKPALLIEFGPVGSPPTGILREQLLSFLDRFALPDMDTADFVPLAFWEIETQDKGKKLKDLSDLAVSAWGDLLAVSGKSHRIGQIQVPLLVSSPKASIQSTWTLGTPTPGQPEGLALTSSGQAIIGLDQFSLDKALFMTAPLLKGRQP